MELHVRIEDETGQDLGDPLMARLLVELVHGVSGVARTAGVGTELLAPESMKRLDQEAPADIDRFRVYCIQRVPYFGKAAAHLDTDQLSHIRGFIRDVAASGAAVKAVFD